MFQFLGAFFLAAFTIPLTVIDLRERRLPNKITYPAIAITLVGVVATLDWPKVLTAVLAGVLLFLLGAFMSFKGWLGMGDAKLLAPVGLLLGWYGPVRVLIGLAVAFFVAGFVVLVRLAFKKITATSTIALGPFILFGFWVAFIPQAWSSIAR